MKRSPFPRRTPLERTSRLAPKRWGIKHRRPRRLDRAGNDDARRDWVAHEECIGVAHIPGHHCSGRIEVCHEGRKPGVAMKAPDSETVPMCTELHRFWTVHLGPFRGWPKERRRDWMGERIGEVTARYLSHGNRRSA